MSSTRREFLATVSAASLVLTTHRHLALATGRVDGPEALITGVRLRTAAPLAAMKEFYRGRLGLSVVGEDARSLTIAGGATAITFETADPEEGHPFYHFAFNIPENKIREARAWQLERSGLLPNLPQLRDPDYPEDVVHFRNWNAHSVFFLDPAENVVEYIARHNLTNRAAGPFTERDILYASEIAFVVDDVPLVASGIREAFALGQYSSGSAAFHAVGDEHGLLLVFRRGRTLSLARPEPKRAEVFPTAATIRGAQPRDYRVPGFPFVIRAH